MNCHLNKATPTIMLIILLQFATAVSDAVAQGTASSGKFNPYLADCYRNVTYLGKTGHHFFITLPHTKVCSVDRKLLPPGLSLNGCNLEGSPSTPGRWAFDVLLEAKCQGINFGEIRVPVEVIIEGGR